ncbi:methylenetetrahydrofolate--tRNA-(uracil(54)-C(5))-methyltransferase (FADH(2)-oxidizing) TrmFO [Candidatus Poribacteria bacterium]|nr:methylenetetrahydrofolate--tRNA-(uracil(54)-C(5))-methyltransferase (FADH(2)-oxidizing) TrmFO [Candidatus Poribacteria bacterium]
MSELIVIGGGLAGSEAAWQAAQHGIQVRLYEMRPVVMTAAHATPHFAELVCSNSLGSQLPDRPSGLLKEELRCMGSMLIECAQETAVPAGGALAVDREAFAKRVTERISQHPRIEIIREEVTDIPNQPTVISSGPLTSMRFSEAIAKLSGKANLYFFDAISPIVAQESIDMEIAFRDSRYGRGEQKEGDYINCPMNREEYDNFVDALLTAERIELRSFEEAIKRGVKAGAHRFFEGCLPVEIIAERGRQSLAFGPMRPVGLTDRRTGGRPAAVVQLRQDNVAATLYNMVGFQTNLKFPEQKRVFQMIPGLEKAEFVRYGQMHRNTFISAPELLHPTLQFRQRDDLFFAGQLTGVEGYMGNIATGLLTGWNAARVISGLQPLILPVTTMLGALCHYVTHASLADFQPMKANFGILPPLEKRLKRKRERAVAYVERAMKDLAEFLEAAKE